MVNVVICKHFWTEDEVKADKNSLYIFGDNDIKKGKGGQAVIRDLPNALGIPTKKYPSHHPFAFYSDLDLEDNKKKIDHSIRLFKNVCRYYDNVVFPEDGFGTGLARLPTMAPLTFAYLNEQVKQLKEFIGEIKDITVESSDESSE